MKKGAWTKVKGSESKPNIAYAGATIPGVQNMQRVASHHLPVLSLLVPKVTFFQLQPIFSSLAASIGTTPQLLMKKILFSNAVFNFTSINTNLKKIERRAQKIRCHFLLVTTRFLANLINFWYFAFSGHFRTRGKIFFASSWSRRISCRWRKKNLGDISRWADFRADPKKSLFRYNP